MRTEEKKGTYHKEKTNWGNKSNCVNNINYTCHKPFNQNSEIFAIHEYNFHIYIRNI